MGAPYQPIGTKQLDRRFGFTNFFWKFNMNTIPTKYFLITEDRLLFNKVPILLN
jgi:hypothetical protein